MQYQREHKIVPIRGFGARSRLVGQYYDTEYHILQIHEALK